MMEMSSDPKSWLAVIGTFLLGILAWFTRRHIAQYDQQRQDMELRVRALESTVATKGDISYLADRLTEISDRSTDQNTAILKMLAERGP